ncbi:hypothetical protein EV426DRAFT_603613 [Tirmania nivea]|nr:hypothetical protein EV426DRAFT_603613 [Tirmania nivea]
MNSKLTLFTLFSAVLTSTGFAQNTTSRDKTIIDTYLVCSNATGSTCPNSYKIASCLEGIEPTIWGKLDASHNASNISNTPLGDVIKNPKLKTCVCSQSQLQGLEDCVNCVRKGSRLTGEIDLFGVGFIAERVCGVVLLGFDLSQKGRTDTRTVFPPTSETNLTTTPRKNQTDTTTPGSNETLQTPTPTQTNDEPSASQSSGAAVANVVVQHLAVPVGLAAVVAFGMSSFNLIMSS